MFWNNMHVFSQSLNKICFVWSWTLGWRPLLSCNKLLYDESPGQSWIMRFLSSKCLGQCENIYQWWHMWVAFCANTESWGNGWTASCSLQTRSHFSCGSYMAPILSVIIYSSLACTVLSPHTPFPKWPPTKVRENVMSSRPFTTVAGG